MSENRFDKILDFLCSGIMSKSERQSVRDELYDHLMCKYETNLAMGMDEEKAKESAINDLGDKNNLKFKLSQVHSYYPKLSVKKALNLLIFGYVLTGFQINIIINTGEITKLIGQVVMLVALFCLSKANDKLKKACILSFSEFTVTKLAAAIAPLVPTELYRVTFSIHIVSCLVGMAKWYFAFDGLRVLTNPYLAEYPKKIPFNFAIFLNLLPLAGFIWLYGLLIVTEETNLNIEGELAFVFVPLVLIVMIITLVVFSRVSKCLWRSDHEYKIETSTAKKTAAAIIALAIAFMPMLAVDLYVSTEKAETEVYSIDDSDISDAEYNRICNNLISYGLVEEFVYALPKSEIAILKDSVPREELGNERFDTKIYHYNQDSILVSVYCCAVGYIDEYGSRVARYMTFIEYSNNVKQKYSDYITMDRINSVPLNYDEQYNGDLLLILSEENGKLIRNEPLEIYTDPDYMVDSISGAKFEAKDSMLIYYGTTYPRDSGQIGENLYLRLYHRTFPFTSMRNPPERGQFSRDILGFEPFTVETLHYIAFPATEETE